MKQNYVMIDYENVQPESIAVLNKEGFNVLLFVGAKQNKIPFEIACAMQKMGERAEYIQITGNGSNALDFHVAYYIGSFSATVSDIFFHIISKDTGFDPLIAHLKTKGIFICRSTSIEEIPLLKPNGMVTPSERADFVIGKMQVQTARPRVLKTLTNHIHSLFQKKLEEDDIVAVISELKRRKFIAVTENKVAYIGKEAAA